jgi:hypothetical protein
MPDTPATDAEYPAVIRLADRTGRRIRLQVTSIQVLASHADAGRGQALAGRTDPKSGLAMSALTSLIKVFPQSTEQPCGQIHHGLPDPVAKASEGRI